MTKTATATRTTVREKERYESTGARENEIETPKEEALLPVFSPSLGGSKSRSRRETEKRKERD